MPEFEEVKVDVDHALLGDDPEVRQRRCSCKRFRLVVAQVGQVIYHGVNGHCDMRAGGACGRCTKEGQLGFAPRHR